MKLSHRLKRIKQKMYIKYKSIAEPSFQGPGTPQQTTAYLICKKLIETEGTILLMAPLSGKRYIKQADGNLFIIITENQIQIINHVYSYIVPMTGRNYYKTCDAFDKKLEMNRLDMENEVKSNIQNTLNKIKRDLSENI